MKFYSRNSSGRRRLDIEELRGLFVSSELLPDRMRSFHTARIGRLVAGEPPILVTPGPTLVLHVLPLEAFRRDQGFPLSMIENGASQLTVPGFPPNACARIRGLSGLTVCCSSSMRPVESYVHLFRNGCVEAALVIPAGDSPSLPGPYLENQILRAVPTYLGYLQRLDIPPPIVLFVSLLGAAALSIIGGDHGDVGQRIHPIGRDVAVLPEIELGDPGANLQAQLKPLFDILWQASGWEGSPKRPPR